MSHALSTLCVPTLSLQPCMHTFCSACYSGWMERSSLCPTCRCPVERIRKNHILNNLVEAYLIQHPGLSRSSPPPLPPAPSLCLSICLSLTMQFIAAV